MYYSGIGDEAAREPEKQVQASLDLGWKHIELRNVRGVNVTDLPDRDFGALETLMARSGLQVSCFASQLGNWSRPINTQFERDLSELRRAIPRMRRLRSSFIRCMSYPNADPPWSVAEWRREAIRRMRELARIAEGEGVTLVHENCSGWGGLNPRSTIDLLAGVDCPAFRLVFDTGNPFQYGLDSLEFYREVRDHIVYVHIKDYLSPTKKGEEQASFPGEGVCKLREILTDLFARGYNGGLSIEPHIASVIHLKKDIQDPEIAYNTYIEYGRRLEKLVAELRPTARK